MTIKLKDGYTPDVDITEDSGGYTITKVFILENDDFTDGMEKRILDYSELPARGDIYNNDATIAVDSKKAEPAADGYRHWLVTVTYKTINADLSSDPTSEKPIINFGSIQYDLALERGYKDGDEEGKPSKAILNTASDPFDPPVIVTKSNQYVSITKNLRDFNPNWIKEYENTVNNSSMTIAGISCDVYQARMLRIGANIAVDSNNENYWIVTYEIEISSEGFIKKVLNQGTNQIVNEKYMKILYSDLGNTGDEKDDQITEPKRLDEDGALINNKLLPSFFVEVKPFFEKKWTSLELPREI